MQYDSKQTIYSDKAIKKALDGEVKINVLHLFRSANELTKTSFSTMATASALTFTIVLLSLLSMLRLLGIPVENYNSMSPTERVLLEMILVLVMSPLMAGLLMMGINRARNVMPKVTDLFKWVKLTIVLALASLIMSMLMQVGLSLFLLPGLYLSVATTFTLTLIADKGLTPFGAILLSVRVVNRYFLQILLFFLVSFGLFMIMAVTLFIASVWLLPLYFNAKGILYNDLFGDGHNNQADLKQSQQGSIFDA